MSEKKISTRDLLHPELLSKEEIIYLLEERYIELDAVQRQDKEILVQICLRTVTPQPQRVPRLNRRGRITEKVIKKLNAARPRIKYDTTGACTVGNQTAQKKSTHSDQRRGLLISSDRATSDGETSRLKPPPITINREKSVIKLNPGKSPDAKSKSVVSPTTGLRRMKIMSPTSGSTEQKEFKVINSAKKTSVISKSTEKSGLSGTVSEKVSGDKQETKKKLLSLKRPTTTTTATSKLNGEESVDTTEDVPKKKIKRISWP